jgi:predicted alpha/beta-fold hydrolase
MTPPFFQRGLLLLVMWAMSVVLLGGGGRAAEERLSMAGLDVTVWQPGETTAAALPIVVFSHGFQGCATQSRFLMAALASAGYLVIAPNHRDAACTGGSVTMARSAGATFSQAADLGRDELSRPCRRYHSSRRSSEGNGGPA